MNTSESKNGESASGGTASTSSGNASTSFGMKTGSGGSGITLNCQLREIKVRGRKLFLGAGPLDRPEVLDNQHLAGMKNDFAELLKIPTDCNFFQFKSEKDWDKEAARSTFSCQKFFNLNVELLSQGLECLPIYEKIRIEKSKISELDIEKSDKKAGEALAKYMEMKENFDRELEDVKKLSKSFEDLTGIKWEPRQSKEIEPKDAGEPVEEEVVDLEAPHQGKYWISHRTELKERGDDSYLAPSSSSDESLEIWLDTYLDD